MRAVARMVVEVGWHQAIAEAAANFAAFVKEFVDDLGVSRNKSHSVDGSAPAEILPREAVADAERARSAEFSGGDHVIHAGTE